MYKLKRDFLTDEVIGIIRLSDNACIPITEENTDYQVYLKWVAEGNVPEEDTEGLFAYTKNAKIQECTLFWNNARVIQIKNGHTQAIKADQDFVNNMTSVINQLQADGVTVYQYRVRDSNNLPLLDANDNIITLTLSLDTILFIKGEVEKRRGYCANSYAYHLKRINILTDVTSIQEYNYQYDDMGGVYTPAQDIIIDSNGNLV